MPAFLFDRTVRGGAEGTLFASIATSRPRQTSRTARHGVVADWDRRHRDSPCRYVLGSTRTAQHRTTGSTQSESASPRQGRAHGRSTVVARFLGSTEVVWGNLQQSDAQYRQPTLVP